MMPFKWKNKLLPNILNLYIAKSYATNFVEICTVYVELTIITVVKRYASMLNCVEFR